MNLNPPFCDQCGKGPFDADALNHHRTSQHPNPRKPLFCDQCGKGPFGSDHSLHHHMVQHRNQRNHLGVHVPVVENPVHCPRCLEYFQFRQDLDYHVPNCGQPQAPPPNAAPPPDAPMPRNVVHPFDLNYPAPPPNAIHLFDLNFPTMHEE